MCGFAGFIDIAKSSSNEVLKQTVERMAETMRHRGPDDGGTWVDASSGVVLGFRRLSIIDLSSAGHQPMISHNGRYIIIFNGEIYNYQDIRKELEIAWRGNSDTETILEAISAWGVEIALKKFIGMFALTLWGQ